MTNNWQSRYGPANIVYEEWQSTEGIEEVEDEILNILAAHGLFAISNSLWYSGTIVAGYVLKLLLEAAFQVGRSVGRQEMDQENEVK